jgi:hypothetical protein
VHSLNSLECFANWGDGIELPLHLSRLTQRLFQMMDRYLFGTTYRAYPKGIARFL